MMLITVQGGTEGYATGLGFGLLQLCFCKREQSHTVRCAVNNAGL